MSLCKKCGHNVPEDSQFCPNCGAPVSAADEFVEYVRQWNETDDTTSQFDPTDIQRNKGMAVVSYLGILVVIPILAASRSRFARFHANQGLVLLIFSAAYGIVRSIAMGILWLVMGGWATWPFNIAYHIVNGATSLVGVLFFIFMILGIVNAAKGRAKELPVIGKIRILK